MMVLKQLQKHSTKMSVKARLNIISIIARVHYDQGNYEAAGKIYNELLPKQKAVLGDDHPHTLTTMSNLALNHNGQGNYETAMEIYNEVLQKKKAALGDNDLET